MHARVRAVGAVICFLSMGFIGNSGGDDCNNPRGLLKTAGLAYFATVLYVLDGQTGEILRYRLSADVPH